MATLSATGGKGVMMFAQRRQRLDQIALEQEELLSRAPAPAVQEPDLRALYHGEEETYVQSAHPAPQQTFVDTSLQPTSLQQENIPQITNQIPEPKASLVPNRTARPFGFINTRAASASSSVSAPVAKKHDMKFKVAVPVHTSAQVWSPTGDIIASRDERISVPAKNTGILPESKKRAAAKQVAAGSSDHQLKNKGDRKSYIEPEEDFFSLGAEACNFMQPRSVKLKIPPPVAPKPMVDPNRQPWLSPPSELFNPPKSPVSPAFASAASGPQGQPYAAPQDWAQRQQMANSTPFQNQLQPTRNSWSAQPAQQSPGLGRAPQSQKAAGAPLMGRGAELFAKRQSRMEKFVVDADTVQANRARSASPTASLPKSWRYSSNIRAPPPLSYNPILAPFYPPAATKQPPSTSPKIKGKNRDKPKPPKKHLNSLDALGRSYSMTLPGRLRPPPPLSGGPPSLRLQPSPGRPPQRQLSWQEWASKPPTPWQAACRSPMGSVDEAFDFLSLRAASHRRSLPEPPADWTRRVSLEGRMLPPPARPAPGQEGGPCLLRPAF
ncbi:hypothetical protein CRUP_005918 [Coryphaenoides rupestris]|nr:hypothetical protein CRUP_005918 [Coryphaenoides rupestris]